VMYRKIIAFVSMLFVLAGLAVLIFVETQSVQSQNNEPTPTPAGLVTPDPSIVFEKNLIVPSKTTDLAPRIPKRDKASLTIRHADGSLERFLLPMEMIGKFRSSLPAEDTIVTMVPPQSLMGHQPPKQETGPASDSGSSSPIPSPPPTPAVMGIRSSESRPGAGSGDPLGAKCDLYPNANSG